MISKDIFILTRNDLFELMNNAYHAGRNKNIFEFDILINEVEE